LGLIWPLSCLTQEAEGDQPDGWEFEKVSQSPQFFYKNNQGIEASVALLLGNCFLINMLGTNKGHNDRLLQPTCRFSLAAIFILGKKRVS
jgi:hypothetical protein